MLHGVLTHVQQDPRDPAIPIIEGVNPQELLNPLHERHLITVVEEVVKKTFHLGVVGGTANSLSESYGSHAGASVVVRLNNACERSLL